MNTKTNKLGYVAAMDSSNSEVTGGIDAFALGVYSVNPEAKVYVKVTNSWFDPDAEKAAAQTLLNMGCDVVTQHCDTEYPQTMAQEKGGYGIGYNSDMSKNAPDACLCSVIWNWGAYYTAAVQSVIDGTWDGSNYYGGMNENLVGITSLADFCEDGTQEAVDTAKEDILSGKNGVFDGVIETNTAIIIASIPGTVNHALHCCCIISTPVPDHAAQTGNGTGKRGVWYRVQFRYEQKCSGCLFVQRDLELGCLLYSRSAERD